MSFWQKTYLCVLAVFLLTFDLGAYGLLKKSYQLNEKMDMSRGLSEYESIEKSLSYILKAYNESTGNSDYESLVSGFAANYYKNNIFLEVYKDSKLIYLNANQFERYREELQSDKSKTVYRKVNDELWIFVGGKMEYMDLKLVMSRNSNYLQEYYDTLIDYFITLSIALSLVLSVILIILLFKLTLPIRRLNRGVKSIALGSYDKRVKVRGNDEISELANNFNIMAESVSNNIDVIKKAGEEKETFINNLTHELKTPITAIKGYSEFLNNANCNEEEKRMAIAYIYEHISRIDLLSGKLMELLYLKNEAISLSLVDTEKLFSDIKKMENHNLITRNITLIIECLADKLYRDEPLLQMLFINLIENSIKASPNGGKIILKSYYHNETTIIEVIDYGKGIPEKYITKIIEAFYVVDKSRSKELGGIGLGLSICNQIATLHNAQINITSKENEFTKVSVVFTTNLQPVD